MKIMVSACLLGENCKYNGGNNLRPELLRLLSGHTVIPVCLEVLGGLPTPRIPAEIVTGTVWNRKAFRWMTRSGMARKPRWISQSGKNRTGHSAVKKP